MIAKFSGMNSITTLGPSCDKTDVLEFIRLTGFTLIDIDFQGQEPDPELLRLVADHVLTEADKIVLRNIETGSTDFIDQMVDEVWGIREGET